MSNSAVTCSFEIDRDFYNEYKNVVRKHGQSVKGNLVSYMNYVINNVTPNAETLNAIKEVECLKKDSNKKTYDTFDDLINQEYLCIK